MIPDHIIYAIDAAWQKHRAVVYYAHLIRALDNSPCGEGTPDCQLLSRHHVIAHRVARTFITRVRYIAAYQVARAHGLNVIDSYNVSNSIFR